jgi:hypothetical protein
MFVDFMLLGSNTLTHGKYVQLTAAATNNNNTTIASPTRPGVLFAHN